MATVQVSRSELLKAVRQLGPAEFDAFLQQAMVMRPRERTATLSAKETKLITRINRGLPDQLSSRYAQLAMKQRKRALTSDEHAEMLKLTEEIESRDAERAAALVELAKLRRVPVRMLMKDMGIKAAPLHG